MLVLLIVGVLVMLSLLFTVTMLTRGVRSMRQAAQRDPNTPHGKLDAAAAAKINAASVKVDGLAARLKALGEKKL